MSKECLNCGAILPDAANFCKTCGSDNLVSFATEQQPGEPYMPADAYIPQEDQSLQPTVYIPTVQADHPAEQYTEPQQPENKEPEKKNKTGLIIGIVAVALLVGIIIGVVAFSFAQRNGGSDDEESQQSSKTTESTAEISDENTTESTSSSTSDTSATSATDTSSTLPSNIMSSIFGNGIIATSPAATVPTGTTNSTSSTSTKPSSTSGTIASSKPVTDKPTSTTTTTTTTTKTNYAYTCGTFDGKTYTNRWANMKLTLPSGYYANTTPVQQDSDYGEGGSYMNVDGTDGIMFSFIKSDLSSSEILSFYLSEFRNTDGFTDATVLNSGKNVTIGGYNYKAAEFKIPDSGGTVYANLYVRQYNGYAIIIVTLSANYPSSSTLINSIKPIN